MSSDGIKRPKRIIAFTPPDHNTVRPATPHVATVPTLRRTGRFQHTLLHSSLSTLPTTGKSLETKMHMLMEPTVHLDICPLVPDLSKDKKDINVGSTSASSPIIRDLVKPSTNMQVREITSCIAAKTDTQDLLFKEISVWVGALADSIAETCAGTDVAFSSWSVVLPLDPEVLPETTLRIDFSPNRLLLRFCTQSIDSLNLISDSSNELVNLITVRLPNFGNIEVELT